MKRLAIAVLFLSSLTVNAQNWPSFRGPNASGVAEGTNPPVTWDLEKSQNVLWKTNIPGLSHSSPIVWGNNIFVITAVSSEAKPTFKAKDRGIGLANDDVSHTWMIFALDKRNGRVLWSEKAYEGVPRAKRHVKATQANSTPVTDGRYVVALFGSEGLACYDTKGKLLWKQDLGVLNPGLWDDKESSWGHASSPIIYRDLVIVQACHLIEKDGLATFVQKGQQHLAHRGVVILKVHIRRHFFLAAREGVFDLCIDALASRAEGRFQMAIQIVKLGVRHINRRDAQLGHSLNDRFFQHVTGAQQFLLRIVRVLHRCGQGHAGASFMEGND